MAGWLLWALSVMIRALAAMSIVLMWQNLHITPFSLHAGLHKYRWLLFPMSTPTNGDHDLDIKMGKVRKFLETGHKVKISIFYRGRENAHRELGYVMIDRITGLLEDDAIVESQPVMAGRNLSITIRSK